MWVDFHCHCLPGMDDGAKDTNTAVKIIQKLKQQGVGRIVATPHFYLHTEEISSFLQRREEAYQKLMETPEASSFPAIVLGAEVSIEKDLAKQNISPLCTEGGTILLELPRAPFKPWMIEEVENIAYGFSVTPILAHIDRYLTWYQKKDFERVLSFEEAVFQVNIDAFLHFRSRHFLKRMAAHGRPMVLGSDAHDLTDRAPNFDRAKQYLQDRHCKKEVLKAFQLAQDRGI
ncbi:MAG: CpsB/CapC family capsule biosynthesis tyrosine phosphatase [Oscillospiraceae bacterium]